MNNVSTLIVGTATGLSKHELDPRCICVRNQYQNNLCDRTKLPGRLYEITNLIVVNILNLQFSIVTSTDESWGSYSANTSTGLVLDLQLGRINTTVPILDFTYARFQAARYSTAPISSIQRGFLVSSGFETPSWSLFKYWRIFDPWTSAFIVLNVLMLWLFIWICRNKFEGRYRTRPYFDVIVALLNFLVMAVFSGKVIRERSARRFHQPFSTLLGATPLIASGEYQWCTSMKNQASLNQIMNGTNSPFESLRSALKNYPPIFFSNFHDFVSGLHNNRKLFDYGPSSYNRAVAFRSGGRLKFIPDDHSDASIFMGFMFNRKSNKLANLFSDATVRLFEVGMIQKINRKYGQIDDESNFKNFQAKPGPFSMTDFNLTFASYFSLTVLSIIVMMISLNLKHCHLKYY